MMPDNACDMTGQHKDLMKNTTDDTACTQNNEQGRMTKHNGNDAAGVVG
jgi:predicted nucleic acid-binding Zn ribbon protein